MPFSELFKGYPFPGAFAKFSVPAGHNDWQPKSWGADGHAIEGEPILIDDNAHFIDDNVQAGDIAYYITSDDPEPGPTIIDAVLSQTELLWGFLHVGDTENIVYKVGMKAPHNLQTLANIVLARGLYAVTIHWNLVWTQAPFKDFLHNHQGDVYVSHNPGKSAMARLLAEEHKDEHGNPIPNPWLNLNPEPEL